MIYLLYGIEDFLLKKELEKIKKDFDKNDISYFDLEEDNLKNIIDAANSISLFSNKRLIIINNSFIFTGSAKKRDDISYLENYIENSNTTTTLVFTVNADKLDSRKKIVNLIKEKGKIIEFNSNYDINKIIKEMFGDYKISNENINLLITRVGNNLNLLEQEINKIKTYKDDDLNITKEDIMAISINNVDTDIFHLIDNIILKKHDKALESYYEMIKIGEEPVKIIIMLANQIRLIYQVKILNKNHYNIFDMMKILGSKKYPIEKALEKEKKFTEELLLKYLYKLSLLDLNIKTGKIDKNIGLELFILEN